MSYTTIPFVNYWRVTKGDKPKPVNDVCFGTMGRVGVPEAVRYVAPISPHTKSGQKIGVEEVDFYLQFMKRLLCTKESPKFSFRRIKEKVYYRIETKGLPFIHALFYLTWFRYPHEFPEMVHELYTRKEEGDTDEILFRKFQQAHNDMVEGKISPTSRHIDCHGLIYNYGGYGGASREPISLAKLAENIKNRRSTVHGYFNS